MMILKLLFLPWCC